MKGRLLRVDDADWVGTLAGSPHDFYHLPAYVALCARQDEGEPMALVIEDGATRMLLPLVFRPIEGGAIDATSPYGYPGPLVTGPMSTTFLHDAFAHASGVLESEGVVSLFVRFHPLLNAVLPEGIGTLVRHGDTISIDLSRPDDVLWSQTRSNHRRGINHALKAGLTVGVDDDGVHDGEFRRLYLATMSRLSADAYYYFDDAYFDGLKEALGSALHLLTVGSGGALAAAGLFVETCGIVQYHLSGTDERFLEYQPTKLLLHHARAWAKARGNRWLHLGGGLGAADDSLLHFKAGFSPLRQPFHTLRLVVDEHEYRRLVRQRHPDVDPGDLAGFFPLYRWP